MEAKIKTSNLFEPYKIEFIKKELNNKIATSASETFILHTIIPYTEIEEWSANHSMIILRHSDRARIYSRKGQLYLSAKVVEDE
uniref:Uncharacterized protein n=1 Tax=viral metagenome TaxID=1070528 RepID=A0A6H1ZLK9_9ZZZZ